MPTSLMLPTMTLSSDGCLSLAFGESAMFGRHWR
jgi:hypothetical protein